MHVLNLMEKFYKSITIRQTHLSHISTLKKELTLRWASELDHKGSIEYLLEKFYCFRNQSLMHVYLFAFH